MSLSIIANESAWGKKGVNNNYLGIQVDNGKWGYPDFEKILQAISIKKIMRVIRDNSRYSTKIQRLPITMILFTTM